MLRPATTDTGPSLPNGYATIRFDTATNEVVVSLKTAAGALREARVASTLIS